MIDINNIERIKGFGDIEGKIYAAEPLQRNSNVNILYEYQKGTDVFSVDGKKGWLANGFNDTIPYLHRLLYQRSSIHNSCVNIIGSLVFGSGLEYFALDEFMAKDESGFYELVEQNLTDSQKDQLVKDAAVFDKNTGLMNYAKEASDQLPLYGGYYGFRDYILDTSGNTRLRSLRIEKYFNMRLGSERVFVDNKFQSLDHLISSDWTSAERYNIKPFSEAKNDKSIINQVYKVRTDNGMMYVENNSGMRSFFTGRITDYRDYYATPFYESLDALSYIDIDYMLSQKDFKDLQNGFALDHIIVRYRDPHEDATTEAKAKKKDVEMFRSFKGFEAENTMMLWVAPNITDDGKLSTPDTLKIITIPNNNSTDRYKVLRDERSATILSAHNIITGELIGLQGLKKSGLSSQSEYLITSLEHLYFAIVQPYQQLLINDVNKILQNAGLAVGVRLKANSVNYKTVTDEILKYAYGLDEIRGKNGDSAMSEEVAEEVAERINNNNNKSQNNF